MNCFKRARERVLFSTLFWFEKHLIWNEIWFHFLILLFLWIIRQYSDDFFELCFCLFTQSYFYSTNICLLVICFVIFLEIKIWNLSFLSISFYCACTFCFWFYYMYYFNSLASTLLTKSSIHFIRPSAQCHTRAFFKSPYSYKISKRAICKFLSIFDMQST